jgi:hypothetical protein
MPKIIDLTGRVFGRLTALELDAENPKKGTFWICRCSCGNIKSVLAPHLKNGNTKSCGCICTENFKALITKHGMRHLPEYQIWMAVKMRCTNPKNIGYPDYGGRGITLCGEWAESFESFYEYLGGRPDKDYSIERINNELGYIPGNVRWATKKEQANNTRANHFLSFRGETHTLAQWAELFGINSTAICKRLRRGWSIEKALTTPLKDNGYKTAVSHCS